MPASVASGEEDEQDIQSGHIDVDELQTHGISVADIGKLKGADLNTVGMVLATHTKKLLNIKGFSDVKVEKIKEACRKATPPEQNGMITCTELLQRRRTCFKIRTGSDNWNKILGGGFESRSVSEVYGEFRCGKTQLFHTMSVTAQLPREEGGAAGKVIVIDTEGTFRPERLIAIAERFKMDPETVVDNVLYQRARNSEHQHEILCGMTADLATGQYRLIMVDSILNLFRGDYQGRGELNERQQKLGVHLRKLVEVAEEFNIAVVMSNQVQSDPGAAMFAGMDGRKPVGGHVMAHASTTRVLLRKGRGDERVAKVMDSPDCPEAEATYIITNGGINDADKA
ncbi:hypothetical protein PRZ48_004804 [Zasmidium cellare]|uniref:Meiotic recombination protein DMC1 n=1 Tax=Zasmidium cellare TaxID=395010 RepID=A0ABR0EQL7_ZASCE|nr:hypothetical protein PRZ48_004804 [Zasmidium cellare]